MLPTGERPAPPRLEVLSLEAFGRGLSAMDGRGAMIDNTRPPLLGYLRRDLLVVDSQVGELEREMATFAEVEGFAMGQIYVESRDNWLAAFGALAESISRHDATAVVLPSLLHFAGIGMPADGRHWFERATGARVLVLVP